MSSDYEYDDEEYFTDGDDMLVDGVSDDEEDMELQVVPEKNKHKAYDVDYTDLTQDQVQKLMEGDIQYVHEVLGVERPEASLLLRYFDWNKEKLVERFMDNANTISVKAGITQAPSSSSSKSSAFSSKTRGDNKIFVCPICFDDTQKPVTPLSCKHAFCTFCWEAYIVSKIREEGEHQIQCMAEGCNLVIRDEFVRETLAGDKNTLDRFVELLARSYVGTNPSLKFCPYPSCTHTVSCPTAAGRSILHTLVPTVTCGADASHTFCFGCDIDGDHRPVICSVARMWIKKCRDDSETANWIKSNTKECGKCQSTIEKNGGCNHMTCKKCKYEFCWVCMGPWTEHGTQWYSCNRYDEREGVEARDAQSKSRASLERYLHYYNRWANHEQSAKLSKELYVKTEKKMEEMQITSELTWIEVQFMKKAVDEVYKCRMTLKWTYAMAYYLMKSNQKELFEDNQRDLERAVEDLSELLESPIEAEQIPMLRQKVTDKTVYVQKRNEIMLEDTASGFADGRWSWNVPVEGFELEETSS